MLEAIFDWKVTVSAVIVLPRVVLSSTVRVLVLRAGTLKVSESALNNNDVFV